jgi:hypothetical protein
VEGITGAHALPAEGFDGAEAWMNAKSLIMIGLVAGSTLGSFLPSLWGAGGLSMSSVLFGAIGGVLGIWAGYRISRL